MRRPRRADDDIRLAGRLIELLEWDHTALKLLCHQAGAFLRTIAHQDSARTLLHQVARRQFAHLARAHQEHGPALERAEYLLCQVHSH